MAQKQRGKKAPYANQPVPEELEDRDVTRALRRNAKIFIRFPAGDLRVSRTGLVDSNGEVCHFNADLPLLMRFLS